MTQKKISPEQIGVLKAVLTTSIVFSAGMIIGVIWLHQKREEELDKVQRDTANDCLDFAAGHYANVIRRYSQASEEPFPIPPRPTTISPYYEEFLEFQRRLDNPGKYEATEEAWAAIEKKANIQQAEYKDRMDKFDVQLTQMN